MKSLVKAKALCAVSLLLFTSAAFAVDECANVEMWKDATRQQHNDLRLRTSDLSIFDVPSGSPKPEVRSPP